MITQFVGLAAFAAGLPFVTFCQPFNNSSIEVAWNVSTNRIPSTVKFFKVISTTYSATAISNLMQIAGLTDKNKKHVTQAGTLGGKDVLTYATKDETRHLDIIASEGMIALHRAGIVAGPKETVTGVPGTNVIVEKLFQLLPILDIEKSEVARDIPGKPIPYTFVENADIHKDKATGKIVTNIVSRGVSFSRQIDGIPVWGPAGVYAEFGNDGKVAELTATWRSIKPRATSAVPTAKDFVALIRTGKTLIRDEQAGFTYRKFVVEDVQLYYWENGGSEHQSSIVPFAVLNVATDLPGENANVLLFVPFMNQ